MLLEWVARTMPQRELYLAAGFGEDGVPYHVAASERTYAMRRCVECSGDYARKVGLGEIVVGEKIQVATGVVGPATYRQRIAVAAGKITQCGNFTRHNNSAWPGQFFCLESGTDLYHIWKPDVFMNGILTKRTTSCRSV